MPRRIHQLKRPKVRQDWSKETLYNLSRLVTPPATNKTFFQQKWVAKAMARGYHNPYVREGQWTRMFDRRMPSVVSMDHRYLAKYDGSEQATGRGSGLDKVDERRRRRQVESRPEGQAAPAYEAEDAVARDFSGRVEKTPYMHMAFHPLERRLDTAIWRALFSSSVKQARQFVVHGWVKVNGKKMIYPGYQLNPGDMFSVDPERVMFATGARKKKKSSPISDQDEIEEKEKEQEAKAARRRDEDEDNFEQMEESESEFGSTELDSELEALDINPDEEKDAKKAIKVLRARAKRILDESKKELSAKRIQELRAFDKLLQKTMAKHGGKNAEGLADSVDNLEVALADIMNKIPSDINPEAATEQINTTTNNPQMQDPDKEDAYAARKDAELLHAALERARANPIDVSKPYATPWKPRSFMSAFAFIPRYLEVNQNICSAVYLRHPVARPGLAEVPTPFSGETMGLAFNWYLRRR